MKGKKRRRGKPWPKPSSWRKRFGRSPRRKRTGCWISRELVGRQAAGAAFELGWEVVPGLLVSKAFIDAGTSGGNWSQRRSRVRSDGYRCWRGCGSGDADGGRVALYGITGRPREGVAYWRRLRGRKFLNRGMPAKPAFSRRPRWPCPYLEYARSTSPPAGCWCGRLYRQPARAPQAHFSEPQSP